MFQTTNQIEMLHHLGASPFCLSWIFFSGSLKSKNTSHWKKKQITSNQAMLSNVFSNMDCRSQSNYPSMVFPGYPRWVGTEKELIFDIRNLKCENYVFFFIKKTFKSPFLFGKSPFVYIFGEVESPICIKTMCQKQGP